MTGVVAKRSRRRLISEMNQDFLTSAFRRLHSRLLAGSRRLIGDDEAADALQEAFVRLWGRRTDIREKSQAEGMLITTVRRLTIDSLRRTGKLTSKEEIPEADPPPEDTLPDLYEQVSAIIAEKLSGRDREILLRRDRDGWEFDEIAEHFGLSEGNVRLIVSRARKTVRTIYTNRHG